MASVRGMIEGMAAVIHISEEEAARDFAAVMRRVRAGDEVVVEEDGRPVILMRPAVESSGAVEDADASTYVQGRTAEEIIERLREWEALHGPLIMGKDFADDVEEAHARFNQPLDSSKWD